MGSDIPKYPSESSAIPIIISKRTVRVNNNNVHRSNLINIPMNDECRKSVTCLQQIGPPKSCSSVPSLFLSNSRSLVNKIDELSGTVSNLLADTVVITETWLTSNVDSAVINLSGFSILGVIVKMVEEVGACALT